MKELIWEHKHRPKSVKDIASEHAETVCKHLEEPSSFPHCLFYSREGGTGKTTMAKAIINDLNADYMMLNSSKDRGIDIVRGRVTEFCSALSTNPNSKKIIWMDEANKLTKAAMDSLKSLIDMYGNNVSFILTTNSLREFEEPFLSRFPLTLDFSQPDKHLVAEYLKSICEKENMECESVDDVKKIVEAYYPSVRRMVNQLQLLKVTSTTVGEFDAVQFDTNEFLYGYLMTKSYDDIIKYIVDNKIDAVSFNNYLFNKIVKSDTTPILKRNLIKILAENEKAFHEGADPMIVFAASVPNIQTIFKSGEDED